jgi:integrase
MQVISLAQQRDPELGCFLRLSAVTGARRVERCAVRWSDLERRTLRISRSINGNRETELRENDTKTQAVCKLALDPATLEILKSNQRRGRQRAKVCGAARRLLRVKRQERRRSASFDGPVPVDRRR